LPTTLFAFYDPDRTKISAEFSNLFSGFAFATEIEELDFCEAFKQVVTILVNWF